MEWKLTEQQVVHMWELAFKADFPPGMEINDAFNAIFLHKGGEWISNFKQERARQNEQT